MSFQPGCARRDGHAGRGGFPWQLNLRRGQAVGLVNEVAERALQGQGFGGTGAGGFDVPGAFLGPALRPDREADLFYDNGGVEIGIHQRPPRPSSMTFCESGATLSP